MFEMKDKSFAELKKILVSPELYTDEEVKAARLEYESRENQQAVFTDEAAAVTVENNDNESVHYPPKPQETERTFSAQKSFFSIMVFVAAFYFIFKWDLSFILILALSIFVHELGHFLAMKCYNYKDLSIFFIPLLGAYASGTKENISQKQQVFILLAGPVPGIVIGLLLFYLGSMHSSDLMIRASNIFIIINLFNLLPIYPLDGGKMVKCLFFESNEKINDFFVFVSMLVISYIAINTKSYALLLLPFLLVMQMKSRSKIKELKEVLVNKGFELEKSFAELTNKEYWLMRDELVYLKAYSSIIIPGKYLVSGSESLIIDQIKTLIRKHPAKDMPLWGKILITLFWLLLFVVPVVVVVVIHKL
jgi:Zn-dependent protease